MINVKGKINTTYSTLALTKQVNDFALKNNKALRVIHHKLEKIASKQLKNFNTNSQTLNTSALINEAWIKLQKSKQYFNCRNHYFACATLAMRQVILDQYRSSKKLALYITLTEDSTACSTPPSYTVQFIESAINQLEEIDVVLANLVLLKFYGGLTNKEIAAIENTSERSIERRWHKAKSLLLFIMNDSEQ